MSNLGFYQKMTWLAKRVGGPLQLAGLFVGSGVVIGVSGTKLLEKAKEKKNQKKMIEESHKLYTINADGISNEGLKLGKGLKFSVLEQDGDALLIDLKNDNNSPYFVSAEFLQSISDYEAK